MFGEQGFHDGVEARAIGADCILLIVAALGDAMLSELLQLAEQHRASKPEAREELGWIRARLAAERAAAAGSIRERDLDKAVVPLQLGAFDVYTDGNAEPPDWATAQGTCALLDPHTMPEPSASCDEPGDTDPAILTPAL